MNKISDHARNILKRMYNGEGLRYTNGIRATGSYTMVNDLHALETVSGKIINVLRDDRLIEPIVTDKMFQGHNYRLTAKGMAYATDSEDSYVSKTSVEADKILEKDEPSEEDMNPLPDVDGEKPRESDNVMGDKYEQHESYGCISLRHTSGGSGKLFGATVKHHNYITLSIQKAEMYRSFNEDRLHAKGHPIVEVSLTPDQLMLALMNPSCSGVPCTINYINGERMEEPPEIISKRQQISEEFEDEVNKATYDAAVLAKETEEILSKKTLKKEDRERLQSLISRIVMETRSNTKFVQQQFEEQLDKSVAEASAQLSHTVSMLAQSMGIEGMSKRLGEESKNTMNTLNG